MPPHRILLDVKLMNSIVARVSDAVIRKSLLPDFQIRTDFLLCSIRESAFDELNRFFQARNRGKKNVNMVGHDDEFVEQISRTPIVKESMDQKSRPHLSREQSASAPRR